MREKKKSLITLIIHTNGIIPLIILSFSGEASFKFNSGARDNHLAQFSVSKYLKDQILFSALMFALVPPG